MKNIFLLLTIMFMACTSLQAEAFYVKVMSVKYKGSLTDIAKRLNKLGFKMHVSPYGEWSRVYAGPFENRQEADNALQVIKEEGAEGARVVQIPPEKKKTPLPKEKAPQKQPPVQEKVTKERQPPQETGRVILMEKGTTLKLDSGANGTKTAEPSATKETNATAPDKPTAMPEKARYFVGLTVGGAKVYSNDKVLSGTFVLATRPDNTGTAFGIEGGYNVNEHVFMTLNYKRTALDDVDFDDLFATVNYRFDDISFLTPYIGALAGYSTMHWKRNPIDALTFDTKSSSFMGGVQIGIDIPVEERVAFYGTYQFWMMEHTTRLRTVSDEEELEHFFEQNFNIGIKYKF